MAIGKKIRFEVFKRDSFRCGYCGGTPPKTILEIDHINPKKHNGTDDINNLITSCFDCNRGKGSVRLTSIPNTLQENIEIIKERESQFNEYEKELRKIRRKENLKIEKICEIYSSYYPQWTLSDKFKESSLRSFLKQLDFDSVKEAMFIACSRPKLNDTNSINYFCGICWKRIKGDRI